MKQQGCLGIYSECGVVGALKHGRRDESMLCPKCGKEVEEGDKFCSSCGTPIEHIRETEVIPEKVPYWVGLAVLAQ